MPVYIMASVAIHDRGEYGKYEAGFMEVFRAFDGELLAVSDAPRVLEGEWPFTRAVLLRFPDAEAARRWYESPGYQAIVKHRWAGADATILQVEGLA